MNGWCHGDEMIDLVTFVDRCVGYSGIGSCGSFVHNTVNCREFVLFGGRYCEAILKMPYSKALELMRNGTLRELVETEVAIYKLKGV